MTAHLAFSLFSITVRTPHIRLRFFWSPTLSGHLLGVQNNLLLTACRRPDLCRCYCYYVQVNHSFWLVSTSSLMTVGLNDCFHNKLFSGLGSDQRNPVMILLYVDLNHPKIIKYYYFSPYQLFCLKICIISNAVRFRNFLHTLI